MIASALWFYLSLACCGAGALALLRRSQQVSLAEAAGLVLSLGAGVMGTVLFWASRLGTLPSLRLEALLGAAGVVAFLVVWRSGQRPRFCALQTPSRGSLLLCALGVIAIAYVVGAGICDAFWQRLLSGDAYNIWGLKAKVLACESLRGSSPFFSDYSLSYSHQNYPLLVPMLMAGVYSAAGAFSEHAARMLFPLATAALAFLMVGFLSRRLRLDLALGLAATALVTPVCFAWASTGYADIWVALYLFAAAAYLARWVTDWKRPDLAMALCHLVFLAFTKNEGMALTALLVMITLALVVLHRRQELLAILAASAAGLLILLPWLTWRAGMPSLDENYPGALASGRLWQNATRIPAILLTWFGQFTNLSIWGLIWFLPPLALLLWPRALRRPAVQFAWLALLSQFTLYTATYIMTPWSLPDLINVTLDRLLLQACPLVILLTGLHPAEASTPTAALDQPAYNLCAPPHAAVPL